jgi:hypothetical protein
MGYRSNVGYKIKFFDIETMCLFVTEAKSKAELMPCFSENAGLEIDEDKLIIKFDVSGWKWYTNYPEVIAHEKLLDLAREYREDEEKQLEYAFARIGEEDDDVTTFSSDEGYDLVYVSRQILFDED